MCDIMLMSSLRRLLVQLSPFDLTHVVVVGQAFPRLQSTSGNHQLQRYSQACGMRLPRPPQDVTPPSAARCLKYAIPARLYLAWWAALGGIKKHMP